jgi:hypothetical protein
MEASFVQFGPYFADLAHKTEADPTVIINRGLKLEKPPKADAAN